MEHKKHSDELNGFEVSMGNIIIFHRLILDKWTANQERCKPKKGNGSLSFTPWNLI